jgi:N-acylglucosamine 2-epimerase
MAINTTSSSFMPAGRVDALLAAYRDGLLLSTLPFWFPRAVDKECGGFMFSRDRDGSLLDTDKAFWLQGPRSVAACYALHGGRDAARMARLVAVRDRLPPHPEQVEWFGYLHRDGLLSSTLKGNTYKGAFHVPGMELTCWQLMEAIEKCQA